MPGWKPGAGSQRNTQAPAFTESIGKVTVMTMSGADKAALLSEATGHHQAGRLDLAKSLYEQILGADPDNVDALGMYGLLAHQSGRNDIATDVLSRAAQLNPRSPDIHLNLGNVLRAAGRTEEAIAHTQQAIDLKPDFPPAYNNIGLMLMQEGALDEAERVLLKVISLAPDYADARDSLGLVAQQRNLFEEAVEHHRAAIERDGGFAEAHQHLGTALCALEMLDEGIASFERALALAPDSFNVIVSYANALCDRGAHAKSLPHYEKALQIDPTSAPAFVSYGMALQESGEIDRAIEQYDRALELRENYAEAQRNKGIAFFTKDDLDSAHDAFVDVLRSSHGGPWWNAETFDPARASGADPDRPLRASTFRIRDAAEQVEYLVGRGLLHESFAEMAERYRDVLAEVEAEVGPDGTMPLTEGQRAKIGTFFDRVVRYKDTPVLSAPAINPDVDFDEIQENYLSSPISVTTFDEFMTPEALAALRAFALENTIFFKYSEARFVSSDLSVGFNCSLLYQMARELKARLPRILGGHALTSVWIYRHRAESVGVEAHSDQGKVTFNFYISPDDANLDPEHGGLVVYTKEQPYDWDWHLYNRNKYRPDIRQEIDAFLESAETLVVPHRQNRALLFNSNLFHRSDQLHFRDDFESRRMNVTILFGKRGPE